MENAAKALMIAGGILLAMLAISVGVYTITEFSGTADEYTETVSNIETRKYNSDFEIFIGRNNVTAQEIMTIVGVSNQKGRYTKIYVDDIDITTYTNDEKNIFLSSNILKYKEGNNAQPIVVENSYSYVSIQYDEQGKVAELKLKKNEI